MRRVTACLLVLLVCTACIVREETSFENDGPVKTDGELDCETNVSWALQAAADPDAEGAATADEALREELERWRSVYGGEVEIVREGVASLVIDGREQVVSSADKSPGGGWLVTTTSGCQGFEQVPVGIIEPEA